MPGATCSCDRFFLVQRAATWWSSSRTDLYDDVVDLYDDVVDVTSSRTDLYDDVVDFTSYLAMR